MNAQMNRRRPRWLLLLLLLLAACQQAPAATDVAAPVAATASATAPVAFATAPPPTPSLPTVVDVTSPAPTATFLPPATPYPAERYADYEMITVLARDAIPAVFDPTFMDADTADDWYDPDELVIGVEFNGEARAYSVPFLSGHEIVNDEVGGVKIAVTW